MVRLNRNLNCLWIGQFISVIGDAALWATIIFLVLALNPPGASTKAGLTAFLQTFPFLLFGFVIGLIGDRYDRKRLMWISDIARMLILLLVPMAFLMGRLNWMIVGVVAFGVGSFAAIFNPARDALLPDLVKDEDLIRINSFFQTTNQMAIIVGTGLAAAILGAVRAAGTESDIPRLVTIFGFDALTYLVSACFILAIRSPPFKGSMEGAGAAVIKHFQGIATWIKSDSMLRGLLFITAIDNLFIMGPATVGMNLFVKDTLSMGPEAVALADFVLSGGMMLSAVAILKYGKNVSKGRMVITGLLLDGATFIPFFWIDDYSVFLVAVFVHSIAIPLIIVPRTTMIQENISRKQLVQAFGLINLTIFGFWSLSGLLSGWLADFMSQWMPASHAPQWLYMFAGIGGFSCGLMALFFKGLRRTD